MNLYEWFWRRLPMKRPITYFWRDLWHQAEFLMMMLWFFTGVAVYVWLGWFGVLLFCIFHTYGFLNGHFFWGKKWIKGQGEDGYEDE